MREKSVLVDFPDVSTPTMADVSQATKCDVNHLTKFLKMGMHSSSIALLVI